MCTIRGQIFQMRYELHLCLATCDEIRSQREPDHILMCSARSDSNLITMRSAPIKPCMATPHVTSLSREHTWIARTGVIARCKYLPRTQFRSNAAKLLVAKITRIQDVCEGQNNPLRRTRGFHFHRRSRIPYSYLVKAPRG